MVTRNVILKVFLTILLVYILAILFARRYYPLYISEQFTMEFYTIMGKVDRILNDHGIRYFIVAGTLLGAVRHQAIIPWDDDIDIGIMESDLEKFNGIDFQSYGLNAKGVERNNIGKIFYLNRLDSGSKMKSVFIDVFVFEKKNDRYMYAYPYAQKAWPNEYFLTGNDQESDELYPLKRYKFGNIWVNGPNKYLPYCERSWGPNWRVPKFKSLKKLLYPIESFQRLFTKPKTPIIREFNVDNDHTATS